MKRIIVCTLISLLSLISCKKDFLNTQPTESVSEQQLTDLANASPEGLNKAVSPVVSGFYTWMRQAYTSNIESDDDFGQKSIDLSTDLMTQDMVQAKSGWFYRDYIFNARDANSLRPRMAWNFYYKLIYNANAVIKKVPEATTDANLKNNLGQALAVRGLAYFYLVQLFQHTYKGHENSPGVPIYTEITLKGKPRAKVSEVYQQLEGDLLKAYDLLQGYSRPSKVYIDKDITAGFLARIYMVMQRWADAAKYAKLAYATYPIMNEIEYGKGFNNINNPEWMWGADITSETTTFYASFFSHVGATDQGYGGALQLYKAIDKRLYEKMSVTDIRGKLYNDPAKTIQPELPPYVNLKFKDIGSWTSDYIYMRASEMYFIEAEALAHQGDNGGAANALYTVISKRDPAYILSVNTGDTLIDEILLQKRIEFWGEGLTFYDLKRLKRGIDRTNSNHPASAAFVIPAEDKRFIFQIPLREMDTNKGMEQNP